MNVFYSLNGFEFNDHLPINNQIRAKPFIKLPVFIYHRHRNLSPNMQPAISQLISKNYFINTF